MSYRVCRGGSRTAATFKEELFVIIVNGWKPLTIITKSSTLDAAAVLDPPLVCNGILGLLFMLDLNVSKYSAFLSYAGTNCKILGSSNIMILYWNKQVQLALLLNQLGQGFRKGNYRLKVHFDKLQKIVIIGHFLFSLCLAMCFLWS